jgi:hypothetical protein
LQHEPQFIRICLWVFRLRFNVDAAGGVDSKGPGLFKVPVDGGDPQRLADGTSTNPMWAPGSVGTKARAQEAFAE